MSPTSTAPLLLASLSAITLHELILRRIEVDHLVLPGIAVSSTVFWTHAYCSGFTVAASIGAAFWGTLSVWILLYRALWHPLRKFPGPLGAKLSKWWSFKQVWDTNWQFYRVQQNLQKQYGDYVRIGPRELAIFDPEAIQPILGFGSQTTKGPVYDIMEKSLHVSRDKAFHRRQRKIWDNGMKDTLSDFAPRIEEFTEQLLTRLRKGDGRPIPLLQHCYYYSYDIMTALAFGEPMGFLKGEASGVAENILNMFINTMDALGLMYHLPWMMRALGILTSLAGPMKQYNDLSVQYMQARIARKDSRQDLMGHLIDAVPKDSAGLRLLYGESRLIISAGSDTTAATLAIIFVQLALHPNYIQSIRKEFRDNASTYHCQRPLPLLDAAINESMRLWPSVYLIGQRVTPPSGLTINNKYIPGNTIVSIPPFAINRNERNFGRPDEFLPERWTTQPELVKNKSSFNPFSTGPYSCVGKPFAMMEMRSVIGRVLNEFDVVLPDGFDADGYFESIKDHFTVGPPPEQLLRFVKADEQE